MSSSISQLLDEARCLVCVGPGGVGKTSTSAALAIRAAQRGRRTIVLTIDPAKRLANALGLPEIGNLETEINPQAFETLSLPVPSAKLTALMLDIKHTWDEVVKKYHPDPERQQKLLDNRLYGALSSALAGSQEYMAMEKLYELSTRSEDPPDLIILDTPPANHAVDFLEAPSRLMEGMNNEATRWLVEPYQERGRLTKRLFDAGSSVFIRTISRFTGTELLDELAELLTCFQGMFSGFSERAEAVNHILTQEDTHFLVVSSPNSKGLKEAEDFVYRLQEKEVHPRAVVLNRAAPELFSGQTPGLAPLEKQLKTISAPHSLAQKLYQNAVQGQSNAQEQRLEASELSKRTQLPVAVVPQLPKDVHDLLGLDQLGAILTAH